jgi:hypothetical protein
MAEKPHIFGTMERKSFMMARINGNVTIVICGRSYTITGSSTTNQRDHLNAEHGIPDPKAPVDTKQYTLDNYRRPLIRLDVLCKLIVEWIMERHHSFNEPESKALHKIFEYLDPSSMNALMSEKVIRSNINKYFETAKPTIKKCLSLARSWIPKSTYPTTCGHLQITKQ